MDPASTIADHIKNKIRSHGLRTLITPISLALPPERIEAWRPARKRRPIREYSPGRADVLLLWST
jgi:hypothetical protein